MGSSEGDILSSAQAESQPQSNQIQGPVILFWMLTFALNAIGQSCGDVLGLGSEHRWVLRVSPVIYAMDTVEVALSWLALVVFRREPISLAATRILRERIKDDHDIRKLKSHTALRWMAFAIGVLPQIIKVLGSTGIPVSQAVAALYIMPWVLFEGLVFAADPAIDTRVNLDESRWFLGAWPVRTVCILLAELGNHGALCVITGYPFLLSLINGVQSSGPISPVTPAASKVLFAARTFFSGAIFIHNIELALIDMYTGRLFGSTERSARDDPQVHVLFSVSAVAFSIVLSTICFCFGSLIYADDSFTSWILLTLGVICVYAGGLVLYIHVRQWRGKPMALLSGYSEGWRARVFLIMLWYYILIYDPAGTSQPNWFWWLG